MPVVFVFIKETMLRFKRNKIDFKQCWYNYIPPFPPPSFSFPRLACGKSDWDNGGGKQCCEGDKLIKQDSSEAAEGKWGKWCTKGPRRAKHGKWEKS